MYKWYEFWWGSLVNPLVAVIVLAGLGLLFDLRMLTVRVYLVIAYFMMLTYFIHMDYVLYGASPDVSGVFNIPWIRWIVYAIGLIIIEGLFWRWQKAGLGDKISLPRGVPYIKELWEKYGSF